MTDRTLFEWTGVCFGCGGDSNLYQIRAGTVHERPSRTTLMLRGSVRLASGRTAYIGPEWRRKEVCARCLWRFRRKASFFVRSYIKKPDAEQRSVELFQLGLEPAEIARAVSKSYATVARWLDGVKRATS